MRRLALFALCGFLCGCGPGEPVTPVIRGAATAELSDPDAVRAADYSVLFVGNSHTLSHDLPGLVARMIRHRHPDKTVLTRTLPVIFLEDAAARPEVRTEVEDRPWKQVVLQGQKISVSGRFEYSRAEAIELAKGGKGRGADVVFYAEWGLKGVDGDGEKQERVYQEMADAAGARVARVRLAWEKALADQPDLPLYSADGNHQSELGAFLTAAVLFGVLTGESPTLLAEFDHPNTDAATRKLLLDAATAACGG